MKIKTFALFSAYVLSYCMALGQSELYVSLQGSEKNNGSREQPFSTLVQAQRAARQMKGKVVVYIRGGIYYLNGPVVFTSEDTRSDGEEITYRSFPGEKVVISGAVRLMLSWRPYRKGIQVAAIHQDLPFDQLFVNGERQPMARYPNYQPRRSHYGGTASDAISRSRSRRWKNPKGGFVHALHKHEWGDFHYVITGKSASGDLQLEGGFQNNRKMGMHDAYRFVENVFEELDTLQEWYFDRVQHKLYLKSAQGLATAIIEVPRLKHLFEFRGSEAAPVRNIYLEGLEMTHTLRTFMENKEPLLRSDWTIYRGGVVVLEGTERCEVRNCRIVAAGGNAIFFSNYNRDNLVSGCEIAGAGASAICFVGDAKAVRSPSFEYHEFVPLSAMDSIPGPKTNNYPSDCKVYNTLIHDIGLVEKQSAGVEISMAKGIQVSHTTIYNVPRAGINVSEGTWGGHVLEYNDVFNTVLETGDHGAFNSWGRDRYWHPDYDTLSLIVANHPELAGLDVIAPIVIRNNRFRCDHGWDIDLDDGSSNYRIYNNVCLQGGIKLREGVDRVVENNIMLNNSFHPHVWFKDSKDVFRHNIVMRNYYPIRLQGWGKEVDYNLFPDSISLVKAQHAGTDLHSLYGPPGFINPTVGDYRVVPGSLAEQVGFKNFEMDSFGVVSDSLRRRATPVALPRLISSHEVKDHRFEWMGTSIKNLNTLGERSVTGMSSETGVYVLEVMTWSPWAAFLKAGDVILAYNGEVVHRILDLERAQLSAGKKDVELKIFRGQKQIRISVKQVSR